LIQNVSSLQLVARWVPRGVPNSLIPRGSGFLSVGDLMAL